jgi:uncharacterized membrane protein YuzA (DUF378 family)
MEKNVLDWIALIVIIIGGLNWGIVGFFNYNVIDAIFGVMSNAARVVYAVVGIAAIYAIYSISK